MSEAVALSLIERGLLVFPCKADKKPYTANGFKSASTEPHAVVKWWKK
jgi:putative DNA primase/helicase